MDGRLADQGRRQVDVLRHGRERRGDLGRKDEVADPRTRGDDLRERRRVEHVLAALELEQGRKRLAVEADAAVGIVLEHGQRVLTRQLDETAAAIYLVLRPFIIPLLLQHTLDYADEAPARLSSLVLRSLSP